MNNRCRICLDEVPKLYPINGTILNCDEEINTMIKYCTSIELELSEDLPDGICVPCFKTLRIAYNFIVQFKENHEKLLQEREILISPNDAINLKREHLEEKKEIAPGGSQEICEKQEMEDAQLEEQVEYELLEEDQEQELVEQELVEQELVEQEGDEEEYEYQEVEVENLGEFLNSLDENGASTSIENFQHNVTVKVIKAEVPLEGDSNHKPQTVLRRKIKIRFSCPVCPSMYFASFENGLLPHMSLHDESFQCNVCVDGILYNPDTFLNHFMKFHRYQCPYCGKSFNRTGTLTAHIKTHSNLRYCCSGEGCNKTFPTSWSLKKHEGIHSTHAEYLCSECNLEFKTYDTYMYHQKKHNGKKFLCMCCGRTFMQSVHLKYHMQQHTGIKHFNCDKCPKSYTSSSQLKKHKTRHHPEQMADNMWVERIDMDQQEYEDVMQ